jgi:hypothetical protein
MYTFLIFLMKLYTFLGRFEKLGGEQPLELPLNILYICLCLIEKNYFLKVSVLHRIKGMYEDLPLCRSTTKNNEHI